MSNTKIGRRDCGAKTREAEPKQQAHEERIGIERREWHVVRNDDVCELARSEHAPRFAEEPFADIAVVPEKDQTLSVEQLGTATVKVDCFLNLWKG